MAVKVELEIKCENGKWFLNGSEFVDGELVGLIDVNECIYSELCSMVNIVLSEYSSDYE